MAQNFIIWENYRQIEVEYLEQLPIPTRMDRPKNLPPGSDELGSMNQQTQGNKTDIYSEEAVFNYAFDKIRQQIEIEIETMPRSKAMDQFKKDTDTLLGLYKNKLSPSMLVATEDEVIKGIAKTFLLDADAMLTKYKPQAQSDSSWKPFLKNMALFFSIIGTLPALFSFAQKAHSGHYRFFDEKYIKDEQLNTPLPSQNNIEKPSNSPRHPE